ncbi:MAG: 4-hydroxy-tetrahydrodipicolinate synthase [Candidatus Methanomethylophilaceae archaeon]|nr:4-hydroxy-tetrahydrodipicolinate synthase [Candidatus Methanomethylophilaceae archaeon]
MFAGTATALITPFDREGEIDEEALRRLVSFQEENGIDTLVPCGSTGESATMSHEEHLRVISIVVDQAKRAKVLAGAGSNSTREAVMLSKSAIDMGADGVLSISPYYVKPTQEGIYRHYKEINDKIDAPIIVYNIPGRTGSNVSVETMMKLAQLPNIAGVKEASGNLNQIQRIITQRPKGFEVLSGDDGLTLPLISLGGDGVVSVTSNCCPGLMSEMVSSARSDDLTLARQLHSKLLPLFGSLFVESNPIPIKYVMSKLGFGSCVPRLPLTPLSDHGRSVIDPILKSLGMMPE